MKDWSVENVKREIAIELLILSMAERAVEGMTNDQLRAIAKTAEKNVYEKSKNLEVYYHNIFSYMLRALLMKLPVEKARPAEIKQLIINLLDKVIALIKTSRRKKYSQENNDRSQAIKDQILAYEQESYNSCDKNPNVYISMLANGLLEVILQNSPDFLVLVLSLKDLTAHFLLTANKQVPSTPILPAELYDYLNITSIKNSRLS